MARPQSTDLLQSFRFHVQCVAPQGENPILFAPDSEGNPVGSEAGFQSVTLPEGTVEATEYREGTYTFTRKFPGPPTFSDCTLMRGVAQKDTAFWHWVKTTWEGGEYRQDLTILHFTRAEFGAIRSGLPQGLRRYELYECVPTRAKPAGDMDATSGEVNMQEVDFAIEWMEVKEGAVG